MYLEVQVRAKTVSGISYQADYLSLVYLVSNVDQHFAAMTVSGRSSVAVIDIHAKSVTGIPSGSCDRSAIRSEYRCSCRCGHIYTLMQTSPSVSEVG